MNLIGSDASCWASFPNSSGLNALIPCKVPANLLRTHVAGHTCCHVSSLFLCCPTARTLEIFNRPLIGYFCVPAPQRGRINNQKLRSAELSTRKRSRSNATDHWLTTKNFSIIETVLKLWNHLLQRHIKKLCNCLQVWSRARYATDALIRERRLSYWHKCMLHPKTAALLKALNVHTRENVELSAGYLVGQDNENEHLSWTNVWSNF